MKTQAPFILTIITIILVVASMIWNKFPYLLPVAVLLLAIALLVTL